MYISVARNARMTIQVEHMAITILVKNTSLKKSSTTSTTVINTTATSTTVTSITTIRNIDTVNLSMKKLPRIVQTDTLTIVYQQLMKKAIINMAISTNIISIITVLMIIARITSPSNLKIQSKKEISTLRLLVYISLATCLTRSVSS